MNLNLKPFNLISQQFKKCNVEDNELILPKIFDILQTIPCTDRIPIELLVYDIDQKRVNALEKAVFTYVTKHDRKELLSMIEQLKKIAISTFLA